MVCVICAIFFSTTLNISNMSYVDPDTLVGVDLDTLVCVDPDTLVCVDPDPLVCVGSTRLKSFKYELL